MWFRRKRGDMIQVYKIINKMYDIDSRSLIRFKETTHNIRGHKHKIEKKNKKIIK